MIYKLSGFCWQQISTGTKMNDLIYLDDGPLDGMMMCGNTERIYYILPFDAELTTESDLPEVEIGHLYRRTGQEREGMAVFEWNGYLHRPFTEKEKEDGYYLYTPK